MEKRDGSRSSDVAILLVCMALVLLTLGAVGRTGRGRAKEVVCQANLRCWGDVFGGIVEENGGKFLSGVNSWGHWWPIQLPHELQDWKKNRTWFCPTATIPIYGENGGSSGLSTWNAWGIHQSPPTMTYEGKTYAMADSGLNGSYGLNGYVIPIPENLSVHTANAYEGGVPAKYGWRNLLDVPDASQVPMFLDALRFDVWPQEAQAPAVQENAAWGASHMARCCINRHDGAVNSLFVDGSVRKVGLKELWTLKWHQAFNTAGPWTKAGGVQPENWPEWMRAFREY
ncbi:MAG: H-X9-DG-CTERM domain-containing protein [Phycisphaerales bacterium]